MPSKALVLDANILVRAVLGKRVRELNETYAEETTFFVPEALGFLQTLRRLTEVIGSDVYGEFEKEAWERLGQRDPEDWPILTTALALGCPIWTEDTDSFGCGVATWSSRNVRTYLSGGQK